MVGDEQAQMEPRALRAKSEQITDPGGSDAGMGGGINERNDRQQLVLGLCRVLDAWRSRRRRTRRGQVEGG